MTYYINERQVRPDGVVNATETVRTEFASALSYYYERKSKMVVNEQFVSVGLMLSDADGNVLESEKIKTKYVTAE